MAGDYTRFRYNPLKDPAGILMQQGRVLLDQDWNEATLLQDRRWRTETTDIIGRAVVPIETPTGFEILISGTNLTIGRGRMYVDGLMAENHGADPQEFDPVLGEVRGTLPIFYDQQPYYPDPPALPADTNPHLVYLDVWERELTYLEDPDLVDKAVAVDTAACLQTVWQVKVLVDTPAGADCSTPSSSLPETAPSAGRLTTAAAGVPASTDPCIVPATGGYRGSGNRLYRIEIHMGGPLGTAQFKWSRDNASVASAVTAINAALDTLTVVMTRRDSVLRFQPGDWVEVTDDVRYFHGVGGEMRQVASVDDVNLTIKLKTALPALEFDTTRPERHTRVIRWDQSGIVRDSVGGVIVDVDTNGGLIPVPAAGTTVVLEDGVQATFSIDPAMPVPAFRPLEYWAFAARVIDASVEILTLAPPRGILHHYAWLAFVTFPSSSPSCRIFWPPPSGDSCDCTVCVSAVSHNTGKLTLQTAINTVKGKGGGKICLGPGVYNIAETVVISGAAAIEISGHGLPTLEATAALASNQPIILIDGSTDITVEDLRMAAGTGVDPSEFVVGLALKDTFFVRIERCEFVFGIDGQTVVNGRTMDPAISLAGLVIDTDLTSNFFNNVATGIGDVRADAKTRLITQLAIESNQMVCTLAGVRLENPAAGLCSEVRFARNFVSSPLGFLLKGMGLNVTVETNSFNLAVGSAAAFVPFTAGVACDLSQVRISNNQINGDSQLSAGRGILLGGPKAVMYGTMVAGNHISNLAGVGIGVLPGTMLLETIISQNQLLNLGGSGISLQIDSSGASAVAVDLNISGNSLAFVAQTPDPTIPGLPLMIGIQIYYSINVNVSENSIENLGMDPTLNTDRNGIYGAITLGMRVAGNRLTNIGPPGAVNGSTGIAVIGFRRIDVVDNEVRRSVAPPAKGDSSPAAALVLLSVGDVSVRGNLLECFGSNPTARVFATASCVFSDNQCLFDNPPPATSRPIVLLRAASVIANSNYIKGPADNRTVALTVISSRGAAVVGNLALGEIIVNGATLPGTSSIPQGSDILNVANP